MQSKWRSKQLVAIFTIRPLRFKVLHFTHIICACVPFRMQKFCLHNFYCIPFHLPPHLHSTISSVHFRLYCIRQNFPCIPATLSLHFSWDVFYIWKTVSLRRIICRETVSLHCIYKPILYWTELYPCVYILVKTECSKVLLHKLCTDCVIICLFEW
jgi:hypothetical protein